MKAGFTPMSQLELPQSVKMHTFKPQQDSLIIFNLPEDWSHQRYEDTINHILEFFKRDDGNHKVLIFTGDVKVEVFP